MGGEGEYLVSQTISVSTYVTYLPTYNPLLGMVIRFIFQNSRNRFTQPEFCLDMTVETHADIKVYVKHLQTTNIINLTITL